MDIRSLRRVGTHETRLSGTHEISLVGAHEIRMRFGSISRQRLYQIVTRPDFPRPFAELSQGKIWVAEHVDAWHAANHQEIGPATTD